MESPAFVIDNTPTTRIVIRADASSATSALVDFADAAESAAAAIDNLTAKIEALGDLLKNSRRHR